MRASMTASWTPWPPTTTSQPANLPSLAPKAKERNVPLPNQNPNRLVWMRSRWHHPLTPDQPTKGANAKWQRQSPTRRQWVRIRWHHPLMPSQPKPKARGPVAGMPKRACSASRVGAVGWTGCRQLLQKSACRMQCWLAHHGGDDKKMCSRFLTGGVSKKPIKGRRRLQKLAPAAADLEADAAAADLEADAAAAGRKSTAPRGVKKGVHASRSYGSVISDSQPGLGLLAAVAEGPIPSATILHPTRVQPSARLQLRRSRRSALHNGSSRQRAGKPSSLEAPYPLRDCTPSAACQPSLCRVPANSGLAPPAD